MIHTAWHDEVLVATLDRPARRNALDHAMLRELHEVLAEAKRARALVLTGAGGAFCSGADLSAVEDESFAELLGALLAGFGTLDAPVIAAIDGPALGAGTQLALACDLRVATPSSRFGIPAAKLGLAIDWWTVQRLAAEVGPAPARAMLLAAATYTASELHAVGFVQRLGDLADALSWAHELTSLAPLTIAAHKRGLEALEARPVDAGFAEARLRAWRSADAQEGKAAFLEKRPPRFTGG